MANKEKKRMTKEAKVFIGIIVLIVAAIIGYTAYYFATPGKLDAFAQCINESDTTFYGAFWCPHCQNQKAMFGKSAQYLPYEECSTQDGQEMLEKCQELGIKAYPTWEFPDGSRAEGEVSLEQLAAKTGCELPDEADTSAPDEGGSSEAAASAGEALEPEATSTASNSDGSATSTKKD